MSTFHITLALEYLQGKNRSERTEAILAQIVSHVANTYMLSAESLEQLTTQAIIQARTRGLLWIGR